VSEDTTEFQRLVAIMDRLRGPQGCPWDHEQTYRSLRPYLIEESFEVACALDRERPEELCEELGDLLLQIVFLARLAKEEGNFTISEVARGISDKMVRRHPHVFGTASAETAEEVLVNWEAIKRLEKKARIADSGAPDEAILDAAPAGLPALSRSQCLGNLAAKVGFDWASAPDVLGKVREELDELERAVGSGEAAGADEELGDLLFSISMLARKLSIDSEGALGRANAKFDKRFRWMEAELARRGEAIDGTGSEELERLWERAKTQSG